MSHEILEVAGAEAVAIAEGNMCGAVTRGTVALPGSEATSRMKGSRRNLGDLTPPAVATAIPGHDRKSRRRSCWGRREESDGCVVPMKPRTKPTTNRQRREWREGGRSKERRAATHAPDSEPGRRVTEAASLRVAVLAKKAGAILMRRRAVLTDHRCGTFWKPLTCSKGLS